MTDEQDKPPEATFYDDPATADLSAKVAQAWSEFGAALADALGRLPAGSRLELTVDPAATGVGEAQFGVTVTPAEDGQLQAFAVGNTTLPPEYRLGRTAIAELVALGWAPPGVLEPGDERFGLRLPAEQAARLAAIISRTLREVYGSPHPAFLVYAMNPAGGGRVEPPSLGAARALPADAERGLAGQHDLSALSLPDKVAAVIAAMLKITPDRLPVDRDGDIGIRSGSAIVFVRVREDPPLIDVFSPILTEIDTTEQLYVRLSELTHRMPIGRLYCTGDTVWASVPVFGRDFQPTHLMLAVQVMTGLADELDDRLHGEFGGKRFFVEGDRAGVHIDADHDRTGMYL